MPKVNSKTGFVPDKFFSDDGPALEILPEKNLTDLPMSNWGTPQVGGMELDGTPELMSMELGAWVTPSADWNFDPMPKAPSPMEKGK